MNKVKTLFLVGAALLSMTAASETYTVKNEYGTRTVTLEFDGNKIKGSRCFNEDCTDIKGVKIDTVLDELEKSIKENTEMSSGQDALFEDLMKQMEEKVKSGKDIIKDGDNRFVILRIGNSGMQVSVDSENKEQEIKGMLKNIIGQGESNLSSMKEIFESKKLPESVSTENYAEVRLPNRIFQFIQPLEVH